MLQFDCLRKHHTIGSVNNKQMILELNSHWQRLIFFMTKVNKMTE